VEVAPHWGEPRISCVFGVLCVVLFLLFFCLVIWLLCMIDRFFIAYCFTCVKDEWMLELTYNAKYSGYIFNFYDIDLSVGMFYDVNKINELMHVVPKCC
jgi:hypothetical protein